MGDMLNVLQHALGLDQYGRGDSYRNHYCASPVHHSYAACRVAVADGLMTEYKGSQISGGDPIFVVTDAGKRHVRENSPPPPKLTRSQKRYQSFLAADCGVTFREYLKATP